MIRLGRWFDARSPRAQSLLGCAGILTFVTVCLYSLGFASFLMRPLLIATPPPATVLITVPTVVLPTTASPTMAPTLFLPGSTLVSTPTQAPIPTRAPTNTPTSEFTPLPFVTPPSDTPEPTLIFLTDTPAFTRTRRPTRTITVVSPTRRKTPTDIPTRTRNPSRTPRPTRTPTDSR